MTNISVQDMTLEDIAEVKGLEQEYSLSTWSINDYKDELMRDDAICLVAKTDNKGAPNIVGFIIARVTRAAETNEMKTGDTGKVKVGNQNVADINNIAVALSFRRMGIGLQLIDGFISAAKSFEIGKIWLEVRESNDTAIRFYTKSGFSKEYIRKDYYQNPAENAVVMLRKLD